MVERNMQRCTARASVRHGTINLSICLLVHYQLYCSRISAILHANMGHFTAQSQPFYHAIWLRSKHKVQVVDYQPECMQGRTVRASAPLTIHICLPFKANRYMMAGKQVAHNRQTAWRFRCLEGSIGMQCQRCHKVSDAKATPSVLRLSLTQPPKVGESNLFAGTFTLSLGGKRWTSHLLALL